MQGACTAKARTMPMNDRFDPSDNPLEFSKPFTRLDLDSSLEYVVQILALVLLGIAVMIAIPRTHGGSSAPPVGAFARATRVIPFAMAVYFARFFLDCTYILDNRDRRVLYRRSFFGMGTTYLVASFDDIEWISVGGMATSSGSNYSRFPGTISWTYRVFMGLKNGSAFPVSTPQSSYGEVANLATSLAEHIGCKTHLMGREDRGAERSRRDPAMRPCRDVEIYDMESPEIRPSVYIGSFITLMWMVYVLFVE